MNKYLSMASKQSCATNLQDKAILPYIVWELVSKNKKKDLFHAGFLHN